MKILYTDLDSLMDTRMGVIAQLSPETATELMSNEGYWSRERDDWEALTKGQVTQEAFNEAWVCRDVTTLQSSITTQLFLVINQLFGDHHLIRMEGLTGVGLRLEINIHPYELTPVEVQVLEEVLKEYCFEGLLVTFISKPMELITPKFLFERYSGALIYDFHRWFKHHAWELGRLKGRDFNLIVPRLFENDATSLSQDEKKKEFFTFKLWLLEHVDIDFIEPQYFSLIPPQVLRETAESTPT